MLLKLFVILVVSCSCAARCARDSLRVYKGDTALLEEFPFIVMMQQREAPFDRWCTASLIAETWVLTAAHCIFHVKEPQNKIIVRFGDFILPAQETRLYAKVIRVFFPTDFMIPSLNMKQILRPVRDDIGLLLIERIPHKPTAKLLALDYRTLVGLPVKYAGFGWTHVTLFNTPVKYRNQSTTPLQVGEGVLLPCDNFKNNGPVICVEPKCSNRAQGGRPGDSGGPLVYDGCIIGVVKGPSSWTIEKRGTSFTPVSIYLEWIKQVMAAHAHGLD